MKEIGVTKIKLKKVDHLNNWGMFIRRQEVDAGIIQHQTWTIWRNPSKAQCSHGHMGTFLVMLQRFPSLSDYYGRVRFAVLVWGVLELVELADLETINRKFWF